MNSQLFFLLNLVFGAVFLIWFLSSRKSGGQKPTQLRLRPGQPPSPPSASAERPAPAPAVKTNSDVSTPKPPEKPTTAPPRPVTPSQRVEKTLNVFFIYNGHDWDAYEVLGLPAGASLTMVTQRYQEVVRTADRAQLEFLDAAYQAILHRK